jgi:nucleoside-diphosphate-sugar epimerase
MAAARSATRLVMKPEFVVSPDDLILVTGSNGFIGSRVLRILLEYGLTKVRCFVRPTSDLTRLKSVLSEFNLNGRFDVVAGDLLSPKDCERATEGVSLIYHLAAGIDKSFAGAFINSALATRNLMDAFLKVGVPRRFVNVSSFAVYSNLTLERGALLDETCPLEDASQERFDAYGFGKLKQEQLVREYGQTRNLQYVIVRPGAVFGPGKRSLTGRVGIDTFGFFVNLGGSNQLPLTYVDNCAEAIVLAGLTPGIERETFNIVDDDLPTGSEFLRAYRQRVGSFFSLRLPYFASSAMCSLWESYSKWSKNQLPPAFNRRRCAAEWKGNTYSNQKLKDRLGWKPRVPMGEAMARFLAQFAPEELAQRSDIRGQRSEG